MTERRTTYLEGATNDDLFQDENDVLLGFGETFTVCSMARAFPGLGPDGTESPSSFPLNNADQVVAPEAGGYSMIAGFAGNTSVAWGNGAALVSLTAASVGLLLGGSLGATGLQYAIFDAGANTVGLWFNGTFFETQDPSGFVPAPEGTPTTVGALAANPAFATFDGRLGVAGIAIANRVLTPSEIADHYNACMVSGSMFDTGVWDELWDARAGLATMDDDTTEWLGEVGGAPLTRVTTDGNFSMVTASAKPRWQ